MQTFALFIFVFWLVFTKLSPRWNTERDWRVAYSLLAAILITTFLCGLGAILLLCFFPEYCYRV